MDAKIIPPPDSTTGAPVSPEQAADLAALQAKITPEPGAPQQPAQAEPTGPDYATEAAGMVDMVAAMIVGYEPKCGPIWDEPRKAGVAAALAPVLEKYNFTLGAMPPEFFLLVMVGPPLYQSSKIIAEGMNSKAAPVAPGTKADTMSAPVVDTSAAATGATHSPEMMALT